MYRLLLMTAFHTWLLVSVLFSIRHMTVSLRQSLDALGLTQSQTGAFVPITSTSLPHLVVAEPYITFG